MLFLSLLFWAFLASYVVHILDETLFTSLLYVIVFYLLIRYGLGRHLMSGADFAIGTTVGVLTVGAFLTVGPTVLFPRLIRHRH